MLEEAINPKFNPIWDGSRDDCGVPDGPGTLHIGVLDEKWTINLEHGVIRGCYQRVLQNSSILMIMGKENEHRLAGSWMQVSILIYFY